MMDSFPKVFCLDSLCMFDNNKNCKFFTFNTQKSHKKMNARQLTRTS